MSAPSAGASAQQLTERQQQALARILDRMKDGWTGSVTLHFRDGDPQAAKYESKETFGGEGLDRRTTGPYR